MAKSYLADWKFHLMNCAGVWKPASNVGGTALGPEAIRVCGETARTENKSPNYSCNASMIKTNRFVIIIRAQ